jgi:SAM-dependent methyltransferase
MSTQAPFDADKFNTFLHRFVEDLGATTNAGLVLIGARLGLYKALAESPSPLTAAELARRTRTAERYVREWLAAQAAGGYVTYHADGDRFSLSAEQAFALTDPDGVAYFPGAFQLALGSLDAVPHIEQCFRSGQGFGWHQHDDNVFEGCERFFRPNYLANLLGSWLPALEGVAARLERGAKVADVGCGLGASTMLMASAFPRSEFHGFDYHQGSIDLARRKVEQAGLGDRVTFERAPARSFPGQDYDLVAFFDSLHDMGDPLGAARHVRQALSADGVWMIVEPMAADSLADNLNPVGRVYYGFSTLLCTPNSLSQEVGTALGAQAGEARLRQVANDAGFRSVKRVAETPFNMVLEARP